MYQSGKCPNCGSKNRDGVLFCEECAFPLTGLPDETGKESEIKTAIEQFRRISTDQFSPESSLVLHIRNEAEPLMVKIGDKQLTVGRVDKANSRRVDIDLTRYGALQKGVSRLHAVFYRGDDDTLYLVDAGSANGTFINGHSIPSNESSPVNNGDEITFGRLRLQAYFERPAFTTNS
jgi:pSer/pThr/pTyr-binding forkhead associated (FHA) protein